MTKDAFVFPGQGSQYVGMGQALFANFSKAKELAGEADEILKCKLSKLIAEGPAEELQKTENTQPALLLISTAFGRILQKKGRQPDYVAGHSLGEYSALVHSGCLSFSDGLKTVRLRGQYMQQAVPLGIGAMFAVIGLEDEKVEQICAEVSQAGQIVSPANYNCTGQLVISGNKEAAEKAAALAKEQGARMCVALPVSAPFHCALMQPAADKLAEQLATITYSPFNMAYVANVDAALSQDAGDVKDKLTAQVVKPVRWKQSVQQMIDQGVERFIEVGAGKVLSGLIKKTDRQVVTMTIDNEKTMEELF